MRTTIFALAGLVATWSGVAQAVSIDEVKQALDAAKSAQNEAKSVQGAWVSTDKLLKQAEDVLAQGKLAKALLLAEKARHEATLAHEQAAYERDHWSPPDYLEP